MMRLKKCSLATNGLPRYRVETNGEVFTVTKLGKQFGFFGPLVYKPLYDCAEDLHSFDTREEAEEMAAYWDKQDCMSELDYDDFYEE